MHHLRRYFRRLFRELSLLLPLLFFSLILINFFLFNQKTQKINQGEIAKAKQIEENLLFWQKISEELPNYRDSYLKLAIFSYQTNHLFAAQKYLQKALSLDPNNSEAKLIDQLFLP